MHFSSDHKSSIDLASKLFSCKFSEMPKSVFTSKFFTTLWQHYAGLVDLTTCMADNNVDVKHCQSLYLTDACWNTSQTEQQVTCLKSFLSGPHLNVSRKQQYVGCLLVHLHKAPSCMEYLEGICQTFKVRVMEAPMNMGLVQGLLQRNPNLKVLHFIPDTRLVLQPTEIQNSATQGLSYDQIISYYCHVIYTDIKSRRTFEHQYGARIKEFYSEDIVKDTTNSIKELSGFLGIQVADQVKGRKTQYTDRNSHMHDRRENIRIKHRENQLAQICDSLLETKIKQ